MYQYFRYLILLFYLLATTVVAEEFIPGRDYTVLPLNQQIKPQAKVVEFFSFTCGSCYRVESTVQQWHQQYGDKITFQRVPVVFNQRRRLLAKGYYIAKQMNIDNMFVTTLFKAIRIHGSRFHNISDLKRFFRQLGINDRIIDKNYNSPQLEQQLRRDNEWVQAFRIYRIPTFVMNGHYKVSLAEAKGDPKRLLTIVTYLSTMI